MPKVIPQNELDQIAEIVSQFPEGLTIRQLSKNLSLSLSDKALRARLNRLIEMGRIHPSSGTKQRRYFPVIVSDVDQLDQLLLAPMVPVSKAGREVFEAIRKPKQERIPVGYNPEFLESYIPNESFYLSQEIRNDLAKIGNVGIDDVPAGTYIRDIFDRILIDLTYNSSRLEGNTYSLLETNRLLELGESADDKQLEETQMILNHKQAIEMLVDSAGEIGFNRFTICNLHATLSDNLLPDPNSSGRLRSAIIEIGGSVYEPLAVPTQIERYFELMLTKASQINDPFEQAFFAMVQLPYLQPFIDVNKRVSRLAANIPFIQNNLCPLSFADVDKDDYLYSLLGVYELNRIDYFRDVFIWAYQRSAQKYNAVRQSLGEPDKFKLHYRSQIKDFVYHVVTHKMSRATATKWVATKTAEQIPDQDTSKFIEIVEMELLSLHEGNIARYGLYPKQYEAWKSEW